MCPQPEPSAARLVTTPAEYSAEERRTLLQLARDAVAATFAGHSLELMPPPGRLAELRGAFTTLHIAGQLRGCVGYVFPIHSLYRTVAETAVAAAFHDVRFPPLSAAELPQVDFEVSVLSPLQPIDAEDVEVGRHGLLITFGNRRGLLLPQVPVEHGWDRETFLAQTCIKAGLPPDAWERGATLEGFTAEVFGTAESR